MQSLVQRVNLWLLSCAAVVHAYDARYLGYRVHAAVPGDSLLHYNALLWWWRFGDSPRGFTLTPSPSFIDLALQLPIAILAPDFERFSYVLALVYAVLIFASLFAVLRIVVGGARVATAVIAAASVAAFYRVSPGSFIVHAFMYNHTSEVFSTLGVVALLYVLFRPGAPTRRYAPALYMAAVAGCIVSSPFFIATYCIPASFGVAALLGTGFVSWRRLLWFGALTAVGAFGGLIALGLISLYVWPVRGDHYLLTAMESYRLFKQTLLQDHEVGYAVLAMAIAAVAAVAVMVAGRRTRTLREPVLFMLAFFPASVLSCTLLPMKRGALGGGYEMRYLQLPWLLTVVACIGAALSIVRAFAAGPLRGRRLTLVPWLAWSAAMILGAAAIVLVVTLRGPLTMHDEASTTSATIACMQNAENTGLHDGLSTGYMARYLNAAMHASDWRSPNVIIQIYSGLPPQVMATESNALWFNGPYRGGKAKLNYLITQTLDDAVLASVRDWIGPPDRTLSCPAPVDLRPDGKPSFDIWIWDRDDAQRTLAELVTHDNLRAPFVPVVGETRMDIDVKWGMWSDLHNGELIDRRRVWRRGVHAEGGSMALVRSFLLPSGIYRADLELSAVPLAGSREPVADILVEMERKPRPLRHFLVQPGMTHAVFEFTVRNIGGPTSGDLLWMNVYPRAAESIEIRGLTLTLVQQRKIDPFRIFR